MSVDTFFNRANPLTLADVASLIGASVPVGCDPLRLLSGVDTLARASDSDITFLAHARYLPFLPLGSAAVIVTTPALAKRIEDARLTLHHRDPAQAFNRIARALYPDAMRQPDFAGCVERSPGVFVHPTARLERDVTLAPGCHVGARAEIGSGTRIGPGVKLAAGVCIGRHCDIGANAVIQCALLGDKVIVGPGTVIGHDGFGYVAGPAGLEKVPQLGRVIIQSGVDIGANSCVDRGALGDTVIGEGTKIDNMVQIAHNVRIGRHCVIAAQTGMSGSSEIGDGAMLGGQIGIADHVKLGAGVMVAAQSGVMRDEPPGARIGGTPARPMRQYFREITLLADLAGRKIVKGDDSDGS
jgi:UDP-3-O-[3-hydroxymyristoyl] glucosamine N-acyltransferase